MCVREGCGSIAWRLSNLTQVVLDTNRTHTPPIGLASDLVTLYRDSGLIYQLTSGYHGD